MLLLFHFVTLIFICRSFLIQDFLSGAYIFSVLMMLPFLFVVLDYLAGSFLRILLFLTLFHSHVIRIIGFMYDFPLRNTHLNVLSFVMKVYCLRFFMICLRMFCCLLVDLSVACLLLFTHIIWATVLLMYSLIIGLVFFTYRVPY